MMAVPVNATILMSFSFKKVVRSSTLLPMLQKMGTFDNGPICPSMPFKKSSAHTLLMQLSMSEF